MCPAQQSLEGERGEAGLQDCQSRLGRQWEAPLARTLLSPNQLTFLGTGLLGAEALLYWLRLEVEQLGESILEAGADWLPAPFRPRSPGERYLSLIFRLVLPLTA